MALAIRLGHAYRSDPGVSTDKELEVVVNILNGKASLEARKPNEPTVVSRAEKILGISKPVIYAFVGCLHHDLGRIGLVISPDCLEGRLQGVTRCDSGGLAGRVGSFIHIADADVPGALIALSIIGGKPDWYALFDDELTRSYPSPAEYILGTVPDYGSWTDARVPCLTNPVPSGRALDRRLWTWEVRLTMPPEHKHYEALVLSHEASKQLEALRLGGTDVPTEVRILEGNVGEEGVAYFSSKAVFQILAGD